MSKTPNPDKADYVSALVWQLTHLPKMCLPRPDMEYRFHPTREWRFDLCWPAPMLKLAVEIDGGVWRRGGGAHTGLGHIRDMEKGNQAILCGYRVLHFIPEDVMTPGGRHTLVALDVIVELFKTLGYKEEQRNGRTDTRTA